MSSSPKTPAGQAVEIREIRPEDRADVVEISRELVRSADTYAFDPEIDDDGLWRYWAPEAPGQGYVALADGAVAGVFVIRPNHPGPASHVANASYAVRAGVRGLGLGRRMGEASLKIAAEHGYRAMQFNIVLESNRAAVHLWESLGFRVIGTIPEGFRMPDGRYVGFHVMHRSLP